MSSACQYIIDISLYKEHMTSTGIAVLNMHSTKGNNVGEDYSLFHVLGTDIIKAYTEI